MEARLFGNLPENNDMKDDVSILINSCDKYSDLWEVFFPLFFKYWPDCPWKIYLGANEKIYPDPRVTTICVGRDISWADSALRMLIKIPSTNVLFFLDDFFIFWPVDTAKVKHHYDSYLRLNANWLRLRNTSKIIDPVDGYADLVEIKKGEPYRVALDIAFWKKDVFLALLREGENPWQMEIAGSERSNRYDGFYATREWVIERRNGLEAGKWMRYNLDLLKAEGLVIPEGHKIMTVREEWLRAARKYLWSLTAYRKIRRFLAQTSRFIKKKILRKTTYNE
jgi:hypothetical protein